MDPKIKVAEVYSGSTYGSVVGFCDHDLKHSGFHVKVNGGGNKFHPITGHAGTGGLPLPFL